MEDGAAAATAAAAAAAAARLSAVDWGAEARAVRLGRAPCAPVVEAHARVAERRVGAAAEEAKLQQVGSGIATLFVGPALLRLRLRLLRLLLVVFAPGPSS